MITVKKSASDFKILNLTDTHLTNEEWENPNNTQNRDILIKTVTELVERVHPDLITISGDLSFAGNFEAYRHLADFLDSFSIPWAPVWGNHDNQDGPDTLNRVVDEYLARKLCLYEKGDPALGNGNYVIGIEKDGRIISGLIMMDSHDKTVYYDENGHHLAYAKLLPEQLIWYREQIAMLRKLGCEDTAIILHIPIYAYRTAFFAAVRPGIDLSSEEAKTGTGWNEQYSDSVGIYLENIECYHEDEGMFGMIKELGSTKHVICGHDHINNAIIRYHGVKLIYGLKTGPGAYWTPALNGGTVLTVTDQGITDVRHEYVHIDQIM